MLLKSAVRDGEKPKTTANSPVKGLGLRFRVRGLAWLGLELGLRFRVRGEG